jgi:hypothetical protein
MVNVRCIVEITTIYYPSDNLKVIDSKSNLVNDYLTGISGLLKLSMDRENNDCVKYSPDYDEFRCTGHKYFVRSDKWSINRQVEFLSNLPALVKILEGLVEILRYKADIPIDVNFEYQICDS